MADDFDSDRAPVLECLNHRKWEHRKRGMERAREEYEAGNNLRSYTATHENVVKERTRQVIQAGMEMMAAWAKKAPPPEIAETYPTLVAASMKGEGMKFARDATMDFFLSCFESGMDLEQFYAPILVKSVMKDRKKAGPMAEIVAETLKAFGPKKVDPRKTGYVAAQFLNTPQPAVKDAGARVFVEMARFNFEKTRSSCIPDNLSRALRKKLDAAVEAIPPEERSAAQPTRALRGEELHETRRSSCGPQATEGGEEVVVDDRKQVEQEDADSEPARDCFTSMPQDEYKEHAGAFPRKWSDRKSVYDSIRAACENVGKIQTASRATTGVLNVLRMYLDQETHTFNTRDLMNTIAVVASKLDDITVLTEVFNAECIERICTVFSKNQHARPGIVATLKYMYQAGYNLSRVGELFENGLNARQPKARLAMYDALTAIVVDNFGNEAARKDFGTFFISQGKWDLLIGKAGGDRDAKVKLSASKFLSAFILMIGENKKLIAQWESNTNKQLKARVAEMTPALKVLPYEAAFAGLGVAAAETAGDRKKKRRVIRGPKKMKAPKEATEKPASRYEVDPITGNVNTAIPVLPDQVELKGRSKFKENQPFPNKALRDEFKARWSEFNQMPKGEANRLLGRPVENPDVWNAGRAHRRANEVLAEIANIVERIEEMPFLTPDQLVAAVSLFDHLMGFDEKARNPVGVKKMFAAMTSAFRKTRIEGEISDPVGKAAVHVFCGAVFKLFDSKFAALGTECADTVVHFAGPEKLVPRIFDQALEMRNKNEKIWAAAIDYAGSVMHAYGVDRVNLYWCMNITHEIFSFGRRDGKVAVYNLIAECHRQLGPEWSNMYFGVLGSNIQVRKAVETGTRDMVVGMERHRLARGVEPPTPVTPPESAEEAIEYEEYSDWETNSESDEAGPLAEISPFSRVVSSSSVRVEMEQMRRENESLKARLQKAMFVTDKQRNTAQYLVGQIETLRQSNGGLTSRLQVAIRDNDDLKERLKETNQRIMQSEFRQSEREACLKANHDREMSSMRSEMESVVLQSKSSDDAKESESSSNSKDEFWLWYSSNLVRGQSNVWHAKESVFSSSGLDDVSFWISLDNEDDDPISRLDTMDPSSFRVDNVLADVVGIDNSRLIKIFKKKLKIISPLRVWLSVDVGLPEYMDVFESAGIEDEEDIMGLTADALETELGVESVGHRLRILYFAHLKRAQRRLAPRRGWEWVSGEGSATGWGGLDDKR